MQDRYRFRFWNTKIKCMYEDTGLTSLGVNGSIKLALENNYVIMQSTGKKDKHDTLMYEGDRVYIASEEEYATIEWSDDLARFVIDFEDENVVADFDNYYDKELEVVGNIYEDKQC